MGKSNSALPGPDDVTRPELSNGMVVLARENHASPAVVIYGLLSTGAVFETRETAGLSRMAAAALMRGTQTHSFDEIYETIESIGASLGFSGGRHRTTISGRCLAEDLPTLLSIMAGVLRTPTFPAGQIDLLRDQIVTNLRIRQQDTRYRASQAFNELVYPPEHPYYRNLRGYVNTVSNLTRDQIAGFHRTHYGPRNLALIVVGAVPVDEAVALVEDALGDWQNPQQPDLPALPAVAPPPAILRREVTIADKTQCDITLGVLGPPRTAPDWWPAYMANNILGVFGLYGRLGKVVRDRQGLAYYSYSSIDGREGPGPWQVVAGVNPANVDRAVDSIVAEMARITTEPVTAGELDDSQSSITGLLPLQLESNAGVAYALALIERYRLGLDYFQRYNDTVRSITREVVLEATQRYLNSEAYAIAIAGPSLPPGNHLE
jgi:zinc protease